MSDWGFRGHSDIKGLAPMNWPRHHDAGNENRSEPDRMREALALIAGTGVEEGEAYFSLLNIIEAKREIARSALTPRGAR
ncbi:MULTISPECIES: hypothetical protein [unclassified Mesorhizobium]|uniref:hypothetical protein n=1 Tax=unclassified Mesorhizobium TaxID=325217 RepID=UPI000AC8E537|nr:MULTISPECIES: hypothetical protein [unclassified Mesorhizobium]